MQRRRLISTLVLVCAFGLSLLGVTGTAEAASKFAYPCSTTTLDGFTAQQVCIMNSDGSGETQLTNFSQYEYQPGLGGTQPHEAIAWSPDGTMLAYAYIDSGTLVCKIAIIDAADGSVLGELIKLRGCSPQPRPIAWSPEITPTVAAISPLGQLVIVFLLGAVTALYFSRQRGQTSGLVGS